MATLQRTFISQEEYLQTERTATVKSEYFNGQMITMTDLNELTSENQGGKYHNVIQENLSRAIDEHLQEQGLGHSFTGDQRIFVAETSYYTYPDLAITVGEPDFSDSQVDTLLNPAVIIEVMSAKSSNYDRGSKFENYRGLESLQEYLVIDSRRFYAELWRKNESGQWVLTDQAQHGSDMLHLKTIDLFILMDDAYEQTEGLPEEEFSIR